MEKEKLLPLAKVLVALLCATLLVFQLKKILENYSLFRANTSIWYEANDRLLLPWVTVCPTAPHRQPKKMHFEKDYNKNTWDMEDIFHMETIAAIRGDGPWESKEIRLRLLGRCFALSFSSAVSSLDLSASLTFLANASVHFALHDPGEEIWLSEGLVPTSVRFVHRFDPAGTALAGADVHIEKSTVAILGSETNPCLSYDFDGDFTRCARRRAEEFARAELNCWSPLTKQYLKGEEVEESDLPPPCGDVASSENSTLAMSSMLSVLGRDPGRFGCTRPCRKVRYEAQVSGYHRSTLAFQSDHAGPVLFFFYDSMDVEHREEALVYDLSKLLAAVGGSVGLFLGLNMFKVLSTAVEAIFGKARN